jgi:hypothetical protein
MKRKRHTEGQIIAILKKHEAARLRVLVIARSTIVSLFVFWWGCTQHSQTQRLAAMGTFTKGEDAQFFLDLQSFYDVAYRHVFGASAPAIAAGGSTDTYKVIRAIEKAILFDRCYRCTEKERTNDLLDFERQ